MPRTSLRRVINRLRGRRGVQLIQAIPKPYRDPSWVWVPSPDFAAHLTAYVMRNWLSTAIDRIAEMCVAQPLEIRTRDGASVTGHPLLDLLGGHGRPNPYQDSREFLESHFQRMDVFGNDIWQWVSSKGGAPDSVYQLDLNRVQIEAGDGGTAYSYSITGSAYPLDARAITHFRRASVLPTGVFWGISPVDKLREMLVSDASMAAWNKDFFDSGAPNGVLLVDPSLVNEADAQKLDAEIYERSRKGRQMMVLRASPGAASWADIALRHRDVDFAAGRLLTRQAVFDALGFHVGVVSEASTEAHARVSERLVRNSAYARQVRTATRLRHALDFWPGGEQYVVRFTDVRVVDWEQEQRKLEAVQPYMTVNEVRNRYLDLPAMPGGDSIVGGADGSERSVQDQAGAQASESEALSEGV